MTLISRLWSYRIALKLTLLSCLFSWSMGCTDSSYNRRHLPLTSMVVTGTVAHCQSAYMPVVQFRLPCDDMESHEMENSVFTYYLEITGIGDNKSEVLFRGPALSLNAKQWADSWNLGFGTSSDERLFYREGTFYPPDLKCESIMALAAKHNGQLRMAVGYTLHEPARSLRSRMRVWAAGKSEFIITISDAPELEAIIKWKRRGDFGAIELPNGRGMLFPLSTQAIKETEDQVDDRVR
jgi:hypothetical protein